MQLNPAREGTGWQGQVGDRGRGGATRESRQLPAGEVDVVLGLATTALGAYGILRDGCTARYPDGPCARRLQADERTVFGAVPLALGLVVGAAAVLVGLVLELGPPEEPARATSLSSGSPR